MTKVPKSNSLIRVAISNAAGAFFCIKNIQILNWTLCAFMIEVALA